MTTAEIDLPSRAASPQAISQATAIEQARAVAEVQAAVTVAQRMPRDIKRAEGEMQDACARMALAGRAFYAVPNRGEGPSVHLARELVRIWGNVDYGVRELRRDDAAGESEVQAFAWDQQSNVRSTRTFIVPHARMRKVNGKQTREKLIDLGDIYLSNQNVGARAVRECIFTVLPTWFTEDAQDLCRKTLEDGGGIPLSQRIENMIGHFATIKITLDQLEGKIGRPRASWTARDVAEMAITYTSITRDGLDKDEIFPAAPRVTAAEIQQQSAQQAPPAEAVAETPDPPKEPSQPKITQAQSKKLHAVLGQLAVPERDRKLQVIGALIMRTVESSNDLSRDEAKVVIDTLESIASREDPQANLLAIMESTLPPAGGED